MASPKKLEIELELKCNAQIFWECVKDFIGLIEGGFRENASVEIVTNDGRSPGSIFCIKSNSGSDTRPEVRLKIESLDEEKKMAKYRVIGGGPLMYSESIRYTISVIPNGETSFTKFAVELILRETYDQLTGDYLLIREDYLLKNMEQTARSFERFALSKASRTS